MQLDRKIVEDIQARLADEYYKRLTQGTCKHCGRGPASAAELDGVRKFLADKDLALTVAPPQMEVVKDMPFTDPDEQRVSA